MAKLFQIINGMRGFGVGQRVTSSIWHKPGTFWEVTRVRLKEGDPNHGKAYGIFFWAGKQKSPREEEIRSPLKKEWRLLAQGEAGAAGAGPGAAKAAAAAPKAASASA